MKKPARNQWDFGELFAPTDPPPASEASPAPSAVGAAPPGPKILTVAELTAQVKRLLEKEVGEIWVTGEITNLRAQSSGHTYFTLKDAESQLSCVLFRGEARESRALLKEGRKVVLRGDLTVYEPRGQYQLRVTAVDLQGLGALQAAFEKLKLKLEAEGLFALERKRPLPRYPRRIGLVTSPTGAAIRDVIHVVQRRDPSLEIYLAPCRVQGQGAAEEIADAIRWLNQLSAAAAVAPSPRALPGPLDLILVTRGGGSIEDLWAFNEEIVARAIFESALPVVSAVGHEIDFTISDFVADLRAATPSAAAELITEGVFSSAQFLARAAERIKSLTTQGLEALREDLDQLRHRLARTHPRRQLNEFLQRLDDLQTGLSRCVRQGARDRAVTWRHLSDRLWRVRPLVAIARQRETLTLAHRRLLELARLQLRQHQQRLATLNARLALLGPDQVLARGYSITLDADTGSVIRTAAGVNPDRRLRTRLKTGELHSVVQPPKPGS